MINLTMHCIIDYYLRLSYVDASVIKYHPVADFVGETGVDRYYLPALCDLFFI